ncbi:hypothetical protein DFQ26_001966, partial [Actinomortierella ambigua]
SLGRILVWYVQHPEVEAAYDAYEIQNAVPNSQVTRVNFTSSSNIYLYCSEELLSQAQKQAKQEIEGRNMEAVLSLKRRIKAASERRRSFIKQRQQQQRQQRPQQQPQQQHRTP